MPSLQALRHWSKNNSANTKVSPWWHIMLECKLFFGYTKEKWPIKKKKTQMAQHNTNLTHLVWGKKCFLTINLDKSFADVPFISRRRWSVMSCACLRQCVHICEKCVILTSQRLCVVSPPETLEYEWVQIDLSRQLTVWGTDIFYHQHQPKDVWRRHCQFVCLCVCTDTSKTLGL